MFVDYNKEGKIAIFTINRPEAHNAISPEVFKELSENMVDFMNDDELWVGIITGAGERAFSAGADIKTTLPLIGELTGQPWAEPPVITRGLNLWKPMIAAVNGIAFGGGLELCLASDIRIASENATFALPEVTLGLIPAWGGTQRLPRVIPWAKAAEMLMTGRPIDAQEAYRIGLVNKVVPLSELMSTAKQMAEMICRAGPLAVRAAKRAMIQGSGVSLTEGLELEKELTDHLVNTEDFVEGRTAFQEKRKPQFKGK